MPVDQFPVASIGGKDTDASGRSDLNFHDYSAEVEALGIDPEQAREFLAVLWDIMGRMADLGLRVDVCGQFFDGLEEPFARAAKGIDSQNPKENGEA